MLLLYQTFTIDVKSIFDNIDSILNYLHRPVVREPKVLYPVNQVFRASNDEWEERCTAINIRNRGNQSVKNLFLQCRLIFSLRVPHLKTLWNTEESSI